MINRSPPLFKLVSSWEVDVEEIPFRFRVELFESIAEPRLYRARFLQWELLRMQGFSEGHAGEELVYSDNFVLRRVPGLIGRLEEFGAISRREATAEVFSALNELVSHITGESLDWATTPE
jgi:hypothetical protein